MEFHNDLYLSYERIHIMHIGILGINRRLKYLPRNNAVSPSTGDTCQAFIDYLQVGMPCITDNRISIIVSIEQQNIGTNFIFMTNFDSYPGNQYFGNILNCL